MQKRISSMSARPADLVNRPERRTRRPEALEGIGRVVYAIKFGDMIKIGYTANLLNRMGSLCARRDDLLALRPVADISAEREVHARLAGCAVRGREWYDASDPRVLDVVNEMRSDIGLAPI